MYNSFFNELLLKLRNNNLKEILSNENQGIKDQLRFEEILNKIQHFAEKLEKSDLRSNYFSLRFENNLESREVLTALQAIFGGFTGENLKKNFDSNQFFETKCALIMLTKTICTPFYLNFIEIDVQKRDFVDYFIKKNISEKESQKEMQSDYISKFLFLRSRAISGFLSLNGNFINLYKDDYKDIGGYQNFDNKIFELKNLYKKNCFYQQMSQDDFENFFEKLGLSGAFYVVRRTRKNSCNPKISDSFENDLGRGDKDADLIFVINVKNSQISEEKQRDGCEVKIFCFQAKEVDKNHLFLKLIDLLNKNSIDLKKIFQLY
jgi:hypothetical protein